MEECSQTSRYKDDPRYYCDQTTGIHKLRKEYQRVHVKGAPKRPQTSYMRWVNAPGVRQRIKDIVSEESDQVTFISVGHKFGEIWKAGQWPDGESINKNYYIKMAAKAKRVYDKKASEFKGTLSRRPFTTIKEKDNHRTIYNQFYHDYRIQLIKKYPVLGKKGHGDELNRRIIAEWSKEKVKQAAKIKYTTTTTKKSHKTTIFQPAQVAQPYE
jgi:hypothetical protein